jgi:hypothetical protein
LKTCVGRSSLKSTFEDYGPSSFAGTREVADFVSASQEFPQGSDKWYSSDVADPSEKSTIEVHPGGPSEWGVIINAVRLDLISSSPAWSYEMNHQFASEGLGIDIYVINIYIVNDSCRSELG